jgi:hypothetical protein
MKKGNMFSIVSNGFYMIPLSSICGWKQWKQRLNTLFRESRMDLVVYNVTNCLLPITKTPSGHSITAWQVPHAACEVFHALHETQRL